MRKTNIPYQQGDQNAQKSGDRGLVRSVGLNVVLQHHLNGKLDLVS